MTITEFLLARIGFFRRGLAAVAEIEAAEVKLAAVVSLDRLPAAREEARLRAVARGVGLAAAYKQVAEEAMVGVWS